MLLSLKVSNFCSFKDKFEFSMKPGKAMERFEDNIIMVKNKKVSKISVVVGENAGGKTSFMRSLQYLQYLIQQNENSSTIKVLCYDNNNEIPQSFDIEAILENQVYRYVLEKDRYGTSLEELYIRNLNSLKKNEHKVFSMCRCEVNSKKCTASHELYLNEKYIPKEIFKYIPNGDSKKEDRMNGLFINRLESYGVDIVKPFVHWVKEKVIVNLPDNFSYNIYKKFEKDKEDLEILESDEFLEIFSLVDSSIIAIEVDEQEPFEDSIIVRRRKDGSSIATKIKFDSSGVRDFFAWSVEIWKVIYKGATLFADELDRVLNSILATKVSNYIKVMSQQGQFVFTTHNVLHINTIDFMKEQIYFVNKNKDSLSSEMYPLSAFKEYRYDQSKVYELYLKGLFGGVPND